MRGNRGQGRPVWVLVSVLLAVIVAVTMFKIVEKGDAGRITELVDSTDRTTALTVFGLRCSDWYDSHWTNKPSVNDEKTMEVYGMALGYLSMDEYQNGSRITPCDCIVFLSVRGRRFTNPVTREAQFRKFTNCNEHARKIGCQQKFCGSGTNEATTTCKNEHGCKD